MEYDCEQVVKRAFGSHHRAVDVPGWASVWITHLLPLHRAATGHTG